MRKKSIAVILCSLLSIMLVFMTACGNGEQEDNKNTFNPEGKEIFTVRVDGGSGSGDYFKGNICEAKAEIPAGKQFMYWLSGDDKLSPNAEYKFVVESDIAIKAVFIDDVEDVNKNVYKVSFGGYGFTNGLLAVGNECFGGGRYVQDSECKVTIKSDYADAKNFIGWKALNEDGTLNDTILSTETDYTFKVTGDTKLVPAFDMGLVRYITPGYETARFNTPNNWLEFNREPQGDPDFIDFNDTNIDYLRVNLYSNKDKIGAPAGWFKLRVDDKRPGEMYVAYMDDEKAFECVGGFNNTFRGGSGMSDPHAHSEFFKKVLGDNYISGSNYYFASTVIVKEGTKVTDNDIECVLADSFESELNIGLYYHAL